LSSRQRSLVGHIQGRERELQADVNSAQSELERMLIMASKYQGPEAIREVVQLLGEAGNSSEILRGQVNTEVIPQTNKWRLGVGQILQYLGAGLDYDAIMRAAEEAFDREQQERSATNAASGEVNVYLRHAERIAEKALREQRRQLAARIHAVLQRGDLDAATKAESIRELSAMHEQAQQTTMKKALLIVHTQQGAGLSMQKQQDLLATLIRRAFLAGKEMKPASRSELRTARMQTELALKGAKDDLAGTVKMPGSFLEEGPASALLYGPDVVAGVNVSHAALDEMEGSRSEEDSTWEAELLALQHTV